MTQQQPTLYTLNDVTGRTLLANTLGHQNITKILKNSSMFATVASLKEAEN